MATITTKYSVGDVVYFASYQSENKSHPCPDCKGERAWKVISPAGQEYKTPCPRCSTSYQSDRSLSLTYSAFAPFVRKLTIGSIQFNTAAGAHDEGARYMCRETGVGSGSIYDEAKLFETEEEAATASEVLCREMNSTVQWVVELYNKSLELSDYQLESAKIQEAKNMELRSRSMLYGLEALFEEIEEAESKEDILDCITSYKEYDWKRDLKKAGLPVQEEAV